jgi:phage terminase large subunit GpA-like protein
MSILRLGIDSGYCTNEVYTWVRQQGAGRVLALDPHGRETAAIVGQPSPVDVTVGGKKIKRGVKVWPVAVSRYKSEFYGLLRLDKPEGDTPTPGFCHYPDMPLSFFKQLTNEQLVQRTNNRGFRVSEWQKMGPNEALDVRNYARACAAVVGIDRFTEKDWLAFEGQLSVRPAEAVQPAPQVTAKVVETAPARAAAPPGGWFSGSRKGGSWFQR